MNINKTTISFVVLLLLVGVFAQYSFAQGRGFGRGMFGRGGGDVSEVSLLAMDVVIKHLQDEYQLEDEALKKVQKLAKDAQEEITQERRSLMQGMREMSPEEREDARQELQDIVSDVNSDSLKKLKKLLSKEQLKRVNELKIQRMGLSILNDNIIQDVIGITKEQKEQLKSARETLDNDRQKFMEEMRAQMQEQGGGGFDRTEMQETMTQLNDNFEKETKQVLTDDQKKMLEKMKGKEFKFPERRRRRPDTN